MSGEKSKINVFDILFRDPNSTKTIEAFDASLSWAADGKFSDQDIDEAKLSVFSQVN